MAIISTQFPGNIFVTSPFPTFSSFNYTHDSTEYSNMSVYTNNSEMQVYLDYDERLYRASRVMFQSELLPAFLYLCILLLLGIPGNLIVIYVYGWKWNKSTSRIFVLSLAAMDFLNGVVSIPTEMSLLVNFLNFDHPHFCKLSRTVTSFCNNASVFILIVIAVDRYQRICKPLSKNITPMLAKKLVVAMILFAIFTSWPFFLLFGTQTIHSSASGKIISLVGKTCLIADGYVKTIYPFILVIFLISSHILCDVTFAILYSCIAKSVIRQQTFRRSVKSGRFHMEMSSTAHTQENLDDSESIKYSFLQELAISMKIRNQRSKRGNGIADTKETKCKQKACHTEEKKNKKSSNARATFLQRQISKISKNSKSSDSHQSRKTTVMLFLVTIVFVLSFIPYCIVVIIRSLKPSFYSNLSTPGKAFFHILLRSYFLNAALNPLVYSYVSKNFRMKAKSLFSKCGLCSKPIDSV